MRKNRMMRAASALSIAVLLSTSMISGTFAKYVTVGSGTAIARVAHWGVEIGGMESTLFMNQYGKDSQTPVDYTVASANTVVAPGTANATGVTFSLTGTPEVAVKVAFAVTNSDATGEPTDVFLPVGTYSDWTTAAANDTFTATAYNPVVFTLKDSQGTELASGKLADIESYLEGKSDDYPAGTDLTTVLGGNGTYTLTWAWDFAGNDQADTLLGNLASGKQASINGASTAIDFAISISATQID